MRISCFARCASFLMQERLGEIDEYAGAGGEDDIAARDSGGSVVGYGCCSSVREGFGPGCGAGGEGVDGVGGGGVDGVGVDGKEAGGGQGQALACGWELRECREGGELGAGGVVDDGSQIGRVHVGPERAKGVDQDSIVVDPADGEAIDRRGEDAVFVDVGGGGRGVVAGGDGDEGSIGGEQDGSGAVVDAGGWVIGPEDGGARGGCELAGVVEVQAVVGAEVLAERGA